MLPDKNSNHANNLRDLQEAKQMLSQRYEDESSCFESLMPLNRAAINLAITPDIGEADISALAEILIMQDALIKAAYAHYRLREEA